MITIKDTGGYKFFLQKTVCDDNRYKADRSEVVSVAKHNRGIFYIVHIKNVCGFDPCWTMHVHFRRTPKKLILGCHTFEGVNKKILEKWLKTR